MAKQKGNRMIANNKKAYHDYFIEDKYEAGISLAGTEVKSLRMGKCSIKESFIRIERDEVFIYGMHISPYEKGNIFNKDPLRIRKLLLHDYEIRKLEAQIKEEEQRAKEVEEFEEYVKTDDYIKDTAEEKLDLVDPNEILFRPAQ